MLLVCSVQSFFIFYGPSDAIFNSRAGGGQLEWQTIPFPGAIGAISTPALADLDGDEDLEVIVVTTTGYVRALDFSGGGFWGSDVYIGTMEPLGQGDWTENDGNLPPPFFPSPLVADIGLDEHPELIIAGGDGLHCIGWDGELLWKYPVENGSIFCTPTLCDLDGSSEPENKDMELLFIRDNHNGTSDIVVLGNTGQPVLEQTISWDHPGVVSSIVAEDLDGSLWDGCQQRVPGEGEETALELVVSMYGIGAMVMELVDPEVGPAAGYRLGSVLEDGNWSTSTPVVCNMDTDPGLEIAFPVNNCSGDIWSLWKGGILVTDNDLSVIGGIHEGSAGSAILSSPAICDIDGRGYDEWRDGELDLIFCNTSGFLNILSLNGSVLNMSFDTGASILSSPALCDVDTDRELEIVISNQAGKIFMLDGDPSDAVDEGVPYPYDGLDQDVLWVYDCGTPIGISSPVVADIDMDGQLEAVIATEGGQVLSICCGGRSWRSQEDWSTFHGNNGRTGYYSVPVRYHVYIYPDSSEYPTDNMVRSVLPGGQTRFKLRVMLTGWGISVQNRERVMIEVDGSSVRRNWTAWVETPEYQGEPDPGFVMLAHGEGANISLWVSAPWEGNYGELARINVTGYCSSDPAKNNTCTTLSVLDIMVDYDIHFIDPSNDDPLDAGARRNNVTVDQGSKTHAPLLIRNRGNINDTYTLTLDPPPLDQGWIWYFAETGTRTIDVTLTAPIMCEEFGGESSQIRDVVVHCPADGYGGGEIPVKVMPDSYQYRINGIEALQSPATLLVRIREMASMQILVMGALAHASPGGGLETTVQIWNTGNIKEMELDLTVEDSYNISTLNYPIDPVVVDMGKTIYETINLTISPQAKADTTYILIVNASNEKYGVWDADQVRIQVDPVQGLEVDLDLNDDIVCPWNPARGILRIRSLANFDAEISVNLSSSFPGLEIEFTDSPGGSKGNFELPAFSKISSEVIVTSAGSVPAGKYQLSVSITPNTMATRNFTHEITVGPYPEVTVGFENGMDVFSSSIEYGSDNSLTVKVTNSGNVPSVIGITLARDFTVNDLVPVPFDEDWQCSFTGVQRYNYAIRQVLIQGRYSLDLTQVSIEPDTAYIFQDPQGMPVNIHYVEVDMEARSSIYLKIGGYYSTKNGIDLEDQLSFRVLARVVGKDQNDIASAFLAVVYPDLEFVGPPIFKDSRGQTIEHPKSGKEFMMIVEVRNSGGSDSCEVIVGLTVGADPKRSYDLPSLEPGEVHKAIFILDLEKGQHSFELQIDQDNVLHEYNDRFNTGGGIDNNVMQGNIEVSRASILTLPLASLLILILVGTVAGVFISKMLVRRRLRSSSDEE